VLVRLPKVARISRFRYFICSGSAFPATLAFQIRELERSTNRGLKLDAIVTVIDAENFVGYEDTSPTAKMQASYTDIILIVSLYLFPRYVLQVKSRTEQNKWEHVSERELETVLDHLHTLNELTPKIRCNGRNGVDPALIFGIESKLFLDPEECNDMHHEEVETIRLQRRPGERSKCHCHGDGHSLIMEDNMHESGDHAVDAEIEKDEVLDEQVLDDALAALSKEVVWRVKGFVRLDRGFHIVNWAFGRHELTAVKDYTSTDVIALTVMGERGSVKAAARRLGVKLSAVIS
jgi:G3E family GTPase